MMLLTVSMEIVNFRKNGNRKANKEKYLEVKGKTRKAVYQVKHEVVKNRFADAGLRDNHKLEKFKIAKGVVKSDLVIIDEQCMRNDARAVWQ